MRRRLIVFIAMVGLLALCPRFVRAQELLTNGGLELVFPDRGGFESVPPGWQLEEGPRVPALPPNEPPTIPPSTYLGDYNNGGVTVLPCPATCGAVDAADYVVWREHLGQAFNLPNRHPLLTGNINQFDYNTWKARFGEPYALSLAEPGDFNHLLFEGDWHMWFQPYLGTEALQEDNFAHLTQTVSGTPGMTYTMTGHALFEDYFPGGVVNLNAENPDGTPTGAPFNDGPVSPTDTFFALEFLNSSGAILAGSIEKELKANGQPSDTTWMQHTLSGVAPAGTTSVRVRASMIDGVYNPLPNPEVFQMSFFVDAFSLTATSGEGGGAGIIGGNVPEPASWLLGVIALSLWSALHRRFNSNR